MFTRNPRRGRDDDIPDLRGLTPRTVAVRTADGLRLAAWEFHERPAEAMVVLLHGWAGTKESLDAQIVFARGDGWDVLAPDLRNHGASEGRVTSVGYHETLDVEAAVAHVRADARLSPNIFLWGLSMGAAAAIRAAERDPSIRGVIAESSFVSLRETVRHHARLFYGPLGALLCPLVLALGCWRGRIEINAMDVERPAGR